MSEFFCNKIPCHTSGDIFSPGDKAPNFVLTASDLSLVSLNDYVGKPLLLNIFISVETPVCFESCKAFDKLNAENLNILCISMDLPFTLAKYEKQFPNLTFLSDFRNRSFGEAYHLTIVDGPLAGLLARDVIVIDKDHHIIYQELTPDSINAPNIDMALDALRECAE